MNNTARFNTMASLGASWTQSGIGTAEFTRSTSNSSNHVVLVQGKYVVSEQGRSELSLSVDSTALERKLAVMKMTAELNGQIVNSTAF